MKKIVLASLIAASASAAFGQSNINKGDWMTGGSIDFSSSKQGDYKITNFSLAPNVGFFFIDNLAGGLRVEVSSSKEEFIETYKTSGFTIAPFVRYYFLPKTQKVNVFADASYGFGSFKSGDEPSVSANGFAGKAGAAIFLTPATALEIGLGYKTLKYKGAPESTNTFGAQVGFQIHLPGGKK